jgi:hypothetical protein
MSVEGVSASNGNAYGLQKAESQDPAGEPQVVNIEAAEDDGEEGQGVIELLQEGHFKGVSDVRLRINFFDELAAIEAGELKTAAEGSINGVLGAVGGDSELLLALSEVPEDGEEGLQGLQEAFAAAVNGAKEEFMGSETPSKDGLVEAINWAFEAFIEGLGELFGPEPEVMEEEALAGGVDGGEQTSDTQGAGEESGVFLEPAPETAPAPSMEEALASYISGLKAAFEAAMWDFSGALDGVVVLPELSQPSGNGVAYEKFLVIYSEMRGLEAVSAVTDGAGAVDATA